MMKTQKPVLTELANSALVFEDSEVSDTGGVGIEKHIALHAV